MRRRVLSLLVAMIMVAALCPAPAWAMGMYAMECSAGSDCNPPSDGLSSVSGNWKWDKENCVLTLSGATITSKGGGIFFDSDATIYLTEGTQNTINAEYDGIISSNGNPPTTTAHKVTIDGAGSLTINVEDTQNSPFPVLSVSELEVTGGNVTIYARKDQPTFDKRIGKLTMSGGELTINAARSDDDHGIVNNGNYELCEIFAISVPEMSITGGTLKVTDTQATSGADACIVQAEQTMTLKNCTATFESAAVDERLDPGRISAEKVIVDNATVTRKNFSLSRLDTDPAPNSDEPLWIILKNVIGATVDVWHITEENKRQEVLSGNTAPIPPKTTITKEMFTVDTTAAEYSGQAITKAVSAKNGLREGTDFTVAYSGNTNIGTATITISGKGNYTGDLTYTFEITKATPPTATTTIKKQFSMNTATTGNRVDIAALLPANRGTTTYQIANSDPVHLTNAQVDAAGVLTFDTTAATAKTTCTLTVTATMAHFNDVTVIVSVDLVDGVILNITGVTASNAVYDGSRHTGYTGAPKADGYSGAFHYAYSGRNGTSYSEETAAPTNAGDYTVTITPAEEGYLGDLALNFTIDKATITGVPTCDIVNSAVNLDTIKLYPPVGGFKLGNSTTVIEGQLTWDENRTIEQGTAFGWTFTPTGIVSNYHEKTGYLTPWPKSSGSGSSGGSSGGSSSNNNSNNTTTNPDGSTTTTTTDAAGNVTTTTKEADGSKTVVEKKTNGTVITTKTEADGSTAKTIENPDGSREIDIKQANGTTANVSVSTSGKVEADVALPAAAVNAAEGKAIPLPIPDVRPAAHSADASTVSVRVSGGAAAKVEIPVRNVTPGTVAVIVHDDGTEEIVKKSSAANDNVTLSVTGNTTVKLIDNSKSFDDTKGHWAKDSIDFVTSRELFQGVSDNTFAANTTMNRAMLVTVLHRMENTPAGGAVNFPDVDNGQWYTDAVAWASGKGIVTGTGAGFDPSGNVSREQIAAFLYRYAQTIGVSVNDKKDLTGFSDGDTVSDWATDAMSWAVGTGIITGKTGGALAPADSATRGEVSTMLMRFVSYMN